MQRYYILDSQHRVIAITDPFQWSKWLEEYDRRVNCTRVNDSVEIITSFIGMDHRFGGKGPPLVFETMVFGGPCNRETWRYSSWDDAEIGHEMAVKSVMSDPEK